jgi:hypothetical protein
MTFLLGASAHWPRYGESFFLAAVTVIPILLLGLGLQTSPLIDLATRMIRWDRRRTDELSAQHGEGGAFRRWLFNQIVVGLGLFLVIVADIVFPFVAGTVGELAAIAALIGGYATPLERYLTRDALIGLVLLLGLATATRSFDELNRARRRRVDLPPDLQSPQDVRGEPHR